MRWYALRSKPNREEMLWLQVASHGHQSYYPRLTVKPANPRSRRIRPYFPGYMFVKAKLALVGESAFAWLPYSQGLVSFGGEPAEVSERLLEAARRRVEEINACGCQGSVGPERGETVLIKAGHLQLQAVFDGKRGW
jgi:transcriptional antiterminator RfaH